MRIIMGDKMSKEELRKKAKEFCERKPKLTSERYSQIKEEWNLAEDKFRENILTKEEAVKIQKNLSIELDYSEIKFEDENEFREITKILIEMGAFAKDKTQQVLDSINHEVAHSLPYKEVGIKSYFGWRNILTPPMINAFHEPFGDKFNSLTPLENAQLFYKSLKAVSDPSESDKKNIVELEKKYGDKIKQ